MFDLLKSVLIQITMPWLDGSKSDNSHTLSGLSYHVPALMKHWFLNLWPGCLIVLLQYNAILYTCPCYSLKCKYMASPSASCFTDLCSLRVDMPTWYWAGFVRLPNNAFLQGLILKQFVLKLNFSERCPRVSKEKCKQKVAHKHHCGIFIMSLLWFTLHFPNIFLLLLSSNPFFTSFPS